MNDHIQRGIYLSLMSVLGSIAITLAIGGSWVTFGKLWVLFSATVLGFPLIFVAEFSFDLWIWYLIILHWIGQIMVTLTVGED